MMDSVPHNLEDGFIERDFQFENEVVWEVLYVKGDYNYSTRKLAKALTHFSSSPEDSLLPPPSDPEPSFGEEVPVDFFDEPITLEKDSVEAEEKIDSKAKIISFFSKKFKLLKKKIAQEKIEEQVEPDEDLSVTTEESVETFPETEQIVTSTPTEELKESFTIPDSHIISTKKVERQIADEEHQRLLQEQQQDYLSDQRALHTYNLTDFPLAEPELIKKLAETHSKYFHLLSHLQDTHTPNDFVTAFRIQDRIAYLLDNQTLLYKTLTKKLIKYLERINEKLEKYYEEITLKREDLKKMNAQISRFNEYDRKTQSRINQAEQETNDFKEDLKTYNESLKELEPELQTATETPVVEEVIVQQHPEDINVVAKDNNTIVY